jgi:hypothetical protein
MYERRGQPLLNQRSFLRRLWRHMLLAVGVLLGAWAIGILGYHLVAGLTWIDAVLNAAIILGGMGPVDPILTTAGKLFAAGYALFSGIVFLVAAGVFGAPLLHRILHHFHLEIDETPAPQS